MGDEEALASRRTLHLEGQLYAGEALGFQGGQGQQGGPGREGGWGAAHQGQRLGLQRASPFGLGQEGQLPHLTGL